MDLTTDIVLLTLDRGVPHVLLIRRSPQSDAFPGAWALPGGYVDPGETAEDAARRELAEETGLTVPTVWDFLKVYDDPKRDPRGRVVSRAFVGILPAPVKPRAGDDAAAAKWVPTDRATGLAFDHDRILRDALNRHPDMRRPHRG